MSGDAVREGTPSSSSADSKAGPSGISSTSPYNRLIISLLYLYTHC